MKLLWLTWVVTLLLVVSSCSSNARKPGLPQHAPSEALIIARAAGFAAIKDIDAQTLSSVVEAKGSKLQAAQAAGIASGVLKPTHGIPTGLEAGLLLLDSMPKAQAEDARRLLVWMPKEMASSPAAAAAMLRDIWTRAVTATLPQAKVQLVDVQYEEKPLLARNSIRHRRYIFIDMPACKDCRIGSQALQDYMLPQEVDAPPFLGSRPAYFWGGLHRGESSFGGYPWAAADLEPSQRLDFLLRLSANLPEWAYIYVPYDEKIAPYPQILHQGKALIFVEPGLDNPY
jgi:hypothetical protein